MNSNRTHKCLKAIALFSGGLDSCLAIKAIAFQGIHVTAVYFVTPFCNGTKSFGAEYEDEYKSKMKTLEERATTSGAEFVPYSVMGEFLNIVKSPEHGYGANMNPCIDCKIFFYRKARELMEEHGAHFIITGEVLGQRPMTQMLPTLMMMEKKADVRRMVLRPLSAKLLPVTIPEENEWVDGSRLYDIQGRGRTRQMELAAEWGISDYPTPAGGCLLTDVQFSHRLGDLFDHDVEDLNDVLLLKAGRHFRLSEQVKLITGRNQYENGYLARLVQERDSLLEVVEFGSPLCILRGENAREYIETAAYICKRYSGGRDEVKVTVKVWNVGEEEPELLQITGAMDENTIRQLIIT